MALFGGNGPGTYQGHGDRPYNTELEARLSGLSSSGTVNNPNVPYVGSPRDAAMQAIRDNNMSAYNYIVQNYR